MDGPEAVSASEMNKFTVTFLSLLPGMANCLVTPRPYVLGDSAFMETSRNKNPVCAS